MGASSITDLSIDTNPLIPDKMFSSLFVEGEYGIRVLSLRANGITNIGAKAIATHLKTNRTIVSLNLWHNRIEKDGADAIAEAIKGNPTLFSLNLAHNPLIEDEGIINLCKVLSNYLIPSDELIQKKKLIAELELQKIEEQEGRGAKKGAVKKGAPLSGKKAAAVKTKSAGNDKPVKGAKGGKIEAKPALGKKGAAASSSPAAGSYAALDKGKKSPLKGKKGAKPEEVELDEVYLFSSNILKSVDIATAVIEPMVEYGGQWYIIGNRSLNNLNLSGCGLTIDGLKSIVDVVQDQDACSENISREEGMYGLFRVSLSV
jgi:hypothetical protein